MINKYQHFNVNSVHLAHLVIFAAMLLLYTEDDPLVRGLGGGSGYTPRVRFFGKIKIRIFDPRSLGSCGIKGTDESTLGKDSLVPLMHHDPSDLGSKIRIRIFPKKHTSSCFT